MHFRMLISFVLAVSITSCKNGNEEDSKKPGISAVREAEMADMISRGRYLVTVAGCNDCHSPKIFGQQGPIVDTGKMLSGHPDLTQLPPLDVNVVKPGHWAAMAQDGTAFAGPWGISFAANLTPDSATGIGAWTKDVFISTLRTGKHLGQPNGRPILPPMPWFMINQMTDEDLSAVYAYLRSLPPVKNRVPAPKPPDEIAKK